MKLMGQREGLKFEAKRAEALDDADILPRAVCAMLNAEGGVVCVGADAPNGVVTSVPGVPGAHAAAGRLHDRLVDLIAPSITNAVAVEVDSEAGVEVLRVKIDPEKDLRPYVVKQRGAVRAWVRTQDRVRPLTWEEMRRAVLDGHGATSKKEEAIRAAVESLRERREEMRGSASDLLYLRLVAVPPLALELPAAEVRPLYRAVAHTRNRESGWNFVNPYEDPRRIKGGWSGGALDSVLRLTEHGAVDFTVPLHRLHWQGADDELWPYALIEHPVAVFRFAGVVFGNVDPEHDVLVDLALFGLGRWRLGPFSPRAIGFRTRTHKQFDEPDYEDDPLQFQAREIVQHADRCAWRLLRRVWAAFGYTEDQIPKEFDRDGGFVLPE